MGVEREGMAAVFGFQSSPSGKGCAESGLCPPAQSQPSEGTRVLCVIVNRQCISLSPLLPHQTSPNYTLQPPFKFTCSSPVHTENKTYSRPLAAGLKSFVSVPKETASSSSNLYHSLAASPVRSPHPISLILIRNKGKG